MSLASLAIVDAREWQNLFDLRSGKKLQDESSQTRMVRSILERHPYPGDVERESNRWVSDTALDLVSSYEPELVCLLYAHQFFAGRFTPMTPEQRQGMIADVFQEVERFLRESGYTPVIVGSGDMVELKGEIDLSRVDGVSISSHWSARYAGLHRASARDLEYCRALPQLERVVSRNEWMQLFPQLKCGIDYVGERIPEHLLVAHEGWTFATTGTTLRKPVRIPGAGHTIPVSTPLGRPKAITDIRALIETGLKKEKIALIILEGIGASDFAIPYSLCNNSVGWYYYEPGDALYHTMTTGAHQVFAYPSGYQYHDENDARTDYPFSGYFLTVPERTIGREFKGKSIAVGNHSMFVHMLFGADICVECFARNLYNQGCLGVIHQFK